MNPKEFPLYLSTLIRRTHRWVSIAFTATVAANFIAMGFGEPSLWVVYAPLAPLVLLLFSGLYLFALPHAARWRGASRAGGEA